MALVVVQIFPEPRAWRWLERDGYHFARHTVAVTTVGAIEGHRHHCIDHKHGWHRWLRNR